jgi:hypothetical protein
MTDMAPHHVAGHGPHPARITPQPLRPSSVAHDTHAPVDRLLSEWLRLRTIVDALLQRADGRDGASSHPLATNQEHLDG